MNIALLDKKELKIRKQWIVLLALSTLSKIFSPHSIIKLTTTSADSIWTQIFSHTVNTSEVLLYAYILYYCIYKNPGTKLLTFFIALIPIFYFIIISFAISKNPIGYLQNNYIYYIVFPLIQKRINI